MKNEALQRYVNRVGRWLTLHTERPGLPWHFGVLDHPNVNAFAAPGGYIFVTRGLVEKMHSEAELAGVLAHEIAHVLRKHHLNAIQKAAGTGMVADALSFAARPRARGGISRRSSTWARNSMPAAWTRTTKWRRTAWA